jgi:hypothetical protein
MSANLEQTEGDGGENQCENVAASHKQKGGEKEVDGISRIRKGMHRVKAKGRSTDLSVSKIK